MGNLREDSIFNVARVIDSAEARAAYLEQVCGEEPDLRRRVEALLDAMDSDADFLEPTLAEETIEYPICERPGQRIGPYRLMEQIGEGGMGVVFVAERDAPLKVRAALKIMKPGLDSKDFIARFESERQALAMMDHPNIARVMDAGATSSGRPYFVMELVRGTPLTTYCDCKELPIVDRLQIFIDICHAIAHAHQKAIIHRDIKPSNILVTEHDGKPLPKVIDFGVAKAVNQQLTDQTLYTRSQQILGTPAYMAPEQADPDARGVDTTSDIYSLGVVLYELLTGVLPFEKERFKEGSYDDIRRMLLHEDPVKPSTRVSSLGDKASTISTTRRTDPSTLRHDIKGDLDWVVMTALEKDRSRRYRTVNDLAQDVQNYLEHRPVSVRAPSIVYRVRKYCRRNQSALRLGSVAAALVLTLVVASFAVRSVINERQKEEAIALAHKQVREAKKMIEEEKTDEAFENLINAQTVLRDDPEIARLLSAISSTWELRIDPLPEEVELWRLDIPLSKWRAVDPKSLHVRVPDGFYHFRINKYGYATLEGSRGPGDVTLRATLQRVESIPSGMVRIKEKSESAELDFAIDKFEVTNREFQQFVKEGGYRREELWASAKPFVVNGQPAGFESFVLQFVDQSNRPGPATWVDGRFPHGAADLPVTGVSWYEAMAYAEFIQRRLPTSAEWEHAAFFDQAEQMRRLGNFASGSPRKGGESKAVNFYGLRDMAGNVREWCSSTTTDGRRLVRGGAWNEHNYMFQWIDALPPESRPTNVGFRCASLGADGTVLTEEPLDLSAGPLMTADPFSEVELEGLRQMFYYDKQAPLNPESVRREQKAHWVHEVVEIDAAYNAERFQLHLFFPATASSGSQRFQPLLFFPGTGTIGMKSIEDAGRWADLSIVSGLVQTGRVVCWPVYKGSLERTDGYRAGMPSHKQLEYFVKRVKDLQRSVDYLFERGDMDVEGLAYVGWSQGAFRGPPFLVLEPRLRAGVLMSGGLMRSDQYALDGRKYAPHVDVPVLLLAGKYDRIFESSVVPLLGALGCRDKELKDFPSGHTMNIQDAIGVIDEWLDQRFLGIQRSPSNVAGRVAWLAALASGYMGESRFRLAEEAYREIIELHTVGGSVEKEILSTKYQLALCLLRQGDSKAAVELLDSIQRREQVLSGRAEASDSDAARALGAIHSDLAWNLSGSANASRQDYESAVNHAKLNDQFGLSDRRKWLLAWTFYRIGELDKAADALELSIEKEKAWVGQWALAAIIGARQGADRSARDWLFAAVNATTNDAAPGAMLDEARRLLGNRRKDVEGVEHATAIYERLTRSRPTIASLQTALANELLKKDQYGEAANAYRAAVKIDPTDWSSLVAYGVACQLQGDSESAKSCRGRVCGELFGDSFGINDVDFHARLGMEGITLSDKAERVRARQKRRGEMILDMRSTVAVFVSLNELDESVGRRVLQVLQRPIELVEKPAACLLSEGALLYRLGDFEMCEKRISEAMEAKPPSHERVLGQLFRAMALRKLGDSYTSTKSLRDAEALLSDQNVGLWQTHPVVYRMGRILADEARKTVATTSFAD